jgi:uncharacterized repeat protein (TIGR01451 family)
VPFSIAQNAVQWSKCCTQSDNSVAPTGSITGSTIIGTSYGSSSPANPADAASTAALIYGTRGVTVDHNTIEGSSDVGISVTAGATQTLISYNKINRPTKPDPDSFGYGIDVFTPAVPDYGWGASHAKLICNTFSGWNINVVGAEQIACTPLPNGSLCEDYSAPAPAVESGKNYEPTYPWPIIDATPFTWTVGSGTLPPGLSLSSAGVITGTPTEAGTFKFTVRAVDATGLTARRAQTITIASDCGPPDVITKAPDSPTVTAGGLAGYRITVSNRGRVAARNWWVCDRMPRGMTFVRATRRLRVFRRMRCLVIPRLAPHQHISLHVTARVASNATTTLTNEAEVIPGPPAATPGTPAAVPPPGQLPIGEAAVKQKVRHPAARPPTPAPPPVTG